MTWTEAAFWDCSWSGFLDAWAGHRRFVLGLDPEEASLSRAQAKALDAGLAQWQRTGRWEIDRHG